MSKERLSLPRTHLRQEETDGIVYLLCMASRLKEIQQVMEKRLRTIPDGWRKIRMADAVLDKLVDNLLDTVPIDKLRTLDILMPDTRVHVTYTRQIGKGKDNVSGIASDDLSLLTAAAHDGICKICDGNCDRCPLGKVFDRFLHTAREKGESYALIDMEHGMDVEGILHGGRA